MTRRAIAWLAAGLVAAGCELVPGASQFIDGPEVVTVQVSLRNQDERGVTVRWIGPASGDIRLEACMALDVPVAPGQLVFDITSETERLSLPVEIRPDQQGIATVIGIDATGDIGFGTPPTNPRCANS